MVVLGEWWDYIWENFPDLHGSMVPVLSYGNTLTPENLMATPRGEEFPSEPSLEDSHLFRALRSLVSLDSTCCWPSQTHPWDYGDGTGRTIL